MSFLFGKKKKKKPKNETKHMNVKTNETAKIRQFFKESKATVNSFELGETLGTGTFGRVRLVKCKVQGKTHYFAMKLLKKAEILKLKQVEHIKSEKNILSMISHPFIVNMFHSFKDETRLYMILEYVIGGELFSQLRKVGRFNKNTSQFYAAQIVLALEYLHDKNIVYRDLKPENLLIDRKGNMKITDFGFAKELVDQRTWTLCGTPEYLAPEIIQSKGHGKAVDWWAMGILIYEMLAGYPPFYDEVPFGIYHKILQGIKYVQFPETFGPLGRDLVKKLLTADRTKRYGCLKNGASDIKKHKWFSGMDWDALLASRLRSPFTPKIDSECDTTHFDEYPSSDEEIEIPLKESEHAEFDDF